MTIRARLFVFLCTVAILAAAFPLVALANHGPPHGGGPTP